MYCETIKKLHIKLPNCQVYLFAACLYLTNHQMIVYWKQ